MADLASVARGLEGRPYPAYRALEGSWSLGDIELSVDHVQGDPFAAPSRLSLVVPTGIPTHWLATRTLREAAEDFLLRRFGASLAGERRGSGRSGELGVYRPGPEICERSAVRIDRAGRATVRFTAGLPARGRRILGREAADLLTGDVPAAAGALRVGEHTGLRAHLDSVVRQRALRDALKGAGLVAFIADGSVLPRASGVSQDPLPGAVPFESPPSLRTTLDTPFGPVLGMGVPAGVTVLTGGGFHGKSTVLQALQRGHFDHVPGDGREGVVTTPHAVKVRAEDGRAVRDVDIGDFLGDLPGGRTTSPFRTDDASGSTSQAAAMVEAIETGAKVLLLDEDTSATNLLVRDARMAALIPDD
ncbi:MAG: ABC-ATPase domain-containing protein, partial [Myxococcales bacterium]|nr:ABC-ATPase domain-containing protein [Myxococcales bacterium]